MATYTASQSHSDVPRIMSRLVFRHWGLLMLRGVAAMIFGVFALARPGLTLASLILLFGTYAIVDGLIAIVAAFAEDGIQHRWWLGLAGVVSILVGLATFRAPALTGMILLYYIAAWAIAGGLLQIVGAIRVRKVIDGEWALAAGGVLSVLVGVALIARPGAGAMAFVTLIAMYAIAIGILLTLFSLRMRALSHRLRRDVPMAQR